MAGELVLYWEAGQSNVVANVWREGSPWTHVATDAAMDDTGHGGVYIGDCASIKPGDHVLYTQNGIYLKGKIYAAQDSVHIWHVAKSGNDNNNGHRFIDALLTIGQAVTNASSGDTIIIWPGDYDESVNTYAVNKSITFIGTSRSGSKIVPTTGRGFLLYGGCVLKNLSVEALEQASTGVAITIWSGNDDIRIEDVDAYGAYDSLNVSGFSRLILKNSTFRGKFDGAQFSTSSKGVVADNCIFESLGTYSTGVNGRAMLGSVSGVFNNCVFRTTTALTTGWDFGGIDLSTLGYIALNNCVIEVDTGSGHSGTAFGIHTNHADAHIVAKNCVISVIATNGSVTRYDLWNQSGTLMVQNCDYDVTETSGIITFQMMNLADDAITASKFDQSTAHPVTTAMQKAASVIITGTVSYDNTAASTTIFYSDDITEATADHYNGRIVIFTSGALTGQATDITDYALVSGEGKFTVTALTEAPADNDTFVIV